MRINEKFRFYSKTLYDKICSITRFSLSVKGFLLVPFLCWLALFQFSKWIPAVHRPQIDTTTLPTLEKWILFGHSAQHWPRTVLDAHDVVTSILDLIAAFVYVIHFVVAWIYASGLYLYYRQKITPRGDPIMQPWAFFWCFGIMNFCAVATQIAWPTAPPWYPEVYGTQPPSYSMHGNPAGLTHADSILSFPLFSTIYGNSPVVFGSFPSLHGAWPLMMTLFAPTRVLRGAGVVYASLVWWAAMYLGHHFFLDLLGGAIYVLCAYVSGLTTLEVVRVMFKEKLFSKAWKKSNKNSMDIEMLYFEEYEVDDSDSEDVDLKQLEHSFKLLKKSKKNSEKEKVQVKFLDSMKPIPKRDYEPVIDPDIENHIIVEMDEVTKVKPAPMTYTSIPLSVASA
mmetsp:Transcript_5511/g.7730  ORF Transcript_5511/g.7730 Transcript_5511/m.7730 type:complete len:395 (+) Transcript_5511:144-1328(+)